MSQMNAEPPMPIAWNLVGKDYAPSVLKSGLDDPEMKLPPKPPKETLKSICMSGDPHIPSSPITSAGLGESYGPVSIAGGMGELPKPLIPPVYISSALASLCPRQLTLNEMTLLELLCEAHANAAELTMSASNQMASMMGQAGVDLKSAYIAALASIGGIHAPIERIRRVLENQPHPFWAQSEDKIPGWGNSFHKGVPDPNCTALSTMIDRWPELSGPINSITAMLHKKGKMIFPNLGCYTAAVAIIIDFPHGAELSLVALPRMTAWTKLFLKAKQA